MSQHGGKTLVVVLDGNLGDSLAPTVDELLHTCQILAGLPVGLSRLANDDTLNRLVSKSNNSEGETVANPPAMSCRGSVTANPVRFLP